MQMTGKPLEGIRNLLVGLKPKPPEGIHVCQRCGHRWQGRIRGQPIRCPRCSSPIWMKERNVQAI